MESNQILWILSGNPAQFSWKNLISSNNSGQNVILSFHPEIAWWVRLHVASQHLSNNYLENVPRSSQYPFFGAYIEKKSTVRFVSWLTIPTHYFLIKALGINKTLLFHVSFIILKAAFKKGHHGGLWSSSSLSLQALCQWSNPVTKNVRMYGGGLLNLALGIFQGVLVRCTKGRDKPHLLPTANLRRPPPYIYIGLWWDRSNDTRFVNLVEMSCTYHIYFT